MSDVEESGSEARKLLSEWAPFILLVCLIALVYRDLIGFSPISPINESREGVVDGQLFVPNQKPVALIFGMATLFLVMRLKQLRAYVGAEPPSRSAVPLLAFASGIAIWSHYTGEVSLLLPSLSLALLATAGLLGGAPAFRLMRLPALFLLLAVPIPAVLLNSLVHELQLSTAAMNGVLLSLFGIENTVSGESIYTSGATFRVIEGCSGLRAMETMFMAAIVYQEFVPHSRAYGFILVGISPLIGVVVNQLRVLWIVLYPSARVSEDHTTQGLVMIVVGTLMIAACGELLMRWLPRSESARSVDDRDSHHRIASWPLRRVVFVVVLLSITIVSTRGLPWETARPDHKNPVRLPSTYAGWEGKPVSPDREYFGSTRHTQSILRRYRKGGAEAIVFLAVDTRKRPLVSGISPKNEMLGPGWQVVSRTPLSLRGGEGVRATVSIQKKLDWYAYVVHWQQGTDSFFLEALRNALAFDRSPFQRPYDATVARIGTGLEANTPQARKRALDRIQPLIDLVLREFPAP